MHFNVLFTVHAKRKSVNRVLKYKVLSFASMRLSHLSTHHILCEIGFKPSHLSFVPVLDKDVKQMFATYHYVILNFKREFQT